MIIQMFSKVKLTQTLLLVLLAVESVLCCQTEIPISTCMFNVTYSPGDCYNFTFVECSYTYEVDIPFVGTVIQTAISSDYALCTRECCDPAVVYQQNWGTVDQCRSYHEARSQRNLIIALVLSIVGPPILFIVLYFGVKLCKFMTCCQCLYGGCCESFWNHIFRCWLSSDEREKAYKDDDKAEAKTAAVSVEPIQRVEPSQQENDSNLYSLGKKEEP